MSLLATTYRLAMAVDGTEDALCTDPLKMHLTDHGVLYIEGSALGPDGTGDHAEDLLIVPYDRQDEMHWLLFWRDPEGDPEPLWGREWCGGHEHDDWSTLVTEVYEL